MVGHLANGARETVGRFRLFGELELESAALPAGGVHLEWDPDHTLAPAESTQELQGYWSPAGTGAS